MQGLQRDDIHGGTYKKEEGFKLRISAEIMVLALVSEIYDSDQN